MAVKETHEESRVPQGLQDRGSMGSYRNRTTSRPANIKETALVMTDLHDK
jgi:hypothetical protein